MKKLIAIVLISTFAITANAEWLEGSTVGIPADNGKRPNGVFVRHDGVGTRPAINIPADTWVTIDLTNGSAWDVNGDTVTFQPNLPADTKAVFLSGLAIITHPGGAITCDLWANFRAPGDDLAYNGYQIQTLESIAGSGVRSNAAVWVPVVDRKFEFYWHFTPGCPSLINLSIQAYVR
jgi:hypothetical protein